MFKLTKKQQEIVDSDARIKLIIGGVRSGKTTIAIMNIVKLLNEKNIDNALFLVRSEKEVRLVYRMLRDLIQNNVADIQLLTLEKKGYIPILLSGEYPRAIVIAHRLIDSEFLENYLSKWKIGKDGFRCPHKSNKFENITIDNASSNKYLQDVLKNTTPYISLFGHCPEDKDNIFYKTWCSAYYGDVADTKAFKMSAWDSPWMADRKEELEPELLKRMGLERYVRDYYATWI